MQLDFHVFSTTFPILKSDQDPVILSEHFNQYLKVSNPESQYLDPSSIKYLIGNDCIKDGIKLPNVW